MRNRPSGCLSCHAKFVKHGDHRHFHQGRGLCRLCFRRAQYRGTLDRWPRLSKAGQVRDVLEDVAWLHESGAPPSTWADRLNTTTVALRKLLARHGHPDLARKLSPFEPRKLKTAA